MEGTSLMSNLVDSMHTSNHPVNPVSSENMAFWLRAEAESAGLRDVVEALKQ